MVGITAKENSKYFAKSGELESEFGKELLKKLGIEGDYEGIGHCALGYAAEPLKDAAPRKTNYVYYAE